MNRVLNNYIEWDARLRCYEIVCNGLRTSLYGMGAEQIQERLSAFLGSIDSFHFCSKDGYVAVVSKIRVQRGGDYWRAAKRIDGKVIQRHVGKTANVTFKALENVIQRFAQGNPKEQARAKERRHEHRMRDYRKRFDTDGEEPQAKEAAPRPKFRYRPNTSGESWRERQAREQAEREKEWQERQERLAREKAERERQERARQAKAAQEAAEQAKREKQRRDREARAEQRRWSREYDRKERERQEQERQQKQQERQQAEQRYKQATERMEEAERLWGWAKHASPNNSFAWKTRQQYEQAERDFAEAWAEYMNARGGHWYTSRQQERARQYTYSFVDFGAFSAQSDALRTMGFDAMPSASDLKRRYRDLAMKYHPDRGGDTAMMAKVNAANDLLKKFVAA